ncbi:Uncharacterized protein TPAR_07470 [Tolypocladium paradoxum]|uniref:Extracellular protein n=1 Tax=Tolypocladium paradoxum TaxID=94208 RepID=A0A2S4KQ65_9HYPO|nr:Uncharacterized protein TPAR_07470 [Tolypocladium paradoxum]
MEDLPDALTPCVVEAGRGGYAARMKTSIASLVAALLGLASFSQAHMEMKSPPPFRSKFNKFTTSVDYDMTSPLAAAGSNFPCKGYHKLLGTPQGQPVAEWVPGQSYSMTITGGASHNGGSCQASLSFDKGSTWKVIHSYIGNCPVTGDSSYKFTLPSDTPAGDMLFAWTWFNQIGNREMYMNCAAITVKGGGKKRRGASDPISSRPNMFVANVGNGCGTTEGRDLLFPNPGPAVDMNSQRTAPPTGTCPY